MALDGPFEESVTLNAMPTRNDIIAAITNLRNTKLERDKAYEALSEIERGYVDHADGLPTFGEYAHDDKD